MKHGKNTLRLTALLTAALMLLLTLCGCSRGMIKEDSVHEDLPDIDPEAALQRTCAQSFITGLLMKRISSA